MNNTVSARSSEMVFTPLRDTVSNDFFAAMRIYTDAFPSYERHPDDVIMQRVNNGSNQLIVGKLGQEVVFMALLWPFTNSSFILLDYMATDSKHRGKKIGARFLEHMTSELTTNRKFFILEVEDPAFGFNQQQRQRRIEFYRSNGAKQLAGVQFTLPALQQGSSTRMILMIFPGWLDSSIDSAKVADLVKRIYKELYNRNEQEALANSSGYIGKAAIALY